MCLINSHYLPKLAIRDIPVTKLLLCENGRLVTPYMREPIIAPVLTSKKFYKIKDIIQDVLNSEIGCGFIHSYPSTAKISAIPNANNMIVSPPFIIVDAVIPKGSWYYTAKVRRTITEYASTKLILKLNKLNVKQV